MFEHTKQPSRPMTETESLSMQFVDECFNRFDIKEFSEIVKHVKTFALTRITEVQSDLVLRKSIVDECLTKIDES